MTDKNAAERQRLDSPVDADTRLFVIVGDPIDHVRAPVVWSALMKRYGINAVFLPAHVTSAGIDDAIRGMKALQNLGGMMFTMPHKVAAMGHADTLTERARLAGSLNLLGRDRDGRWRGDNVDGAGFITGLKADGVVLEGANVYVHGCGGVGRSIAWSLAMEPITSLALFDIDTERATALAAAIAAASRAPITAGAVSLSAYGIVINASPVGLKATDSLPFPVDALSPETVVADVVMDPMMTPLLIAARRRRLKIHHGRNMMSFAMPLAAGFFGLPMSHDWNGAPLQS